MDEATETQPLQAPEISLRKRLGSFKLQDVKMHNVTLALDKDLCFGLRSLDLRLDRYVTGRIPPRGLFEVVRNA